MFSVVSENLSGLGYMGSTTSTNWQKYFRKLEKAKDFCEEEYGDKIEWVEEEGVVRSPDLRYVMYWITPLEFEDD